MSLHLFLSYSTSCLDQITVFRGNLKKQQLNNTIAVPVETRGLLFKLCCVFQGFNWTRFVQGVLSSVSIQVLLEEEVVVYSSPYLEKMNEVLPKHSVRSAHKCDNP